MQEEPKQKSKNAWLGGLAVLGIAAMKFKVFLLLMLKGGWVFVKQGLSMFIMIGVYSMFFGWPYAVMIVLLLLIHEGGHFIFMKYFGLEPKLPVFIPFFGAYVAMTKTPPDQAVDAWVSLAGPLVGGVSSAAFYFIGVMQNIPFLMAAGSTGCLLNLMQLLPAKPFDGGFVVNAIARWVLIPGVFMVFIAAALLHSPLFFLLGIFSAYSAWKAFKGRPSDEPVVKPATGMEKVMIGLAYFTLAGTLGYLYALSSAQVMASMPPARI